MQGSQVAQNADVFPAYKVNIEILRGVGRGWVCKIESWVVCGISWDIGSGWVGTNAWCNMESCSGEIQKRDVWDKYVRMRNLINLVDFNCISLGYWFRINWHK